jgi:hypothetical protein
MQPTTLINTDARPPFRVRFSSTVPAGTWVREFWNLVEAQRFAAVKTLRGKPARVEGRK